MPAYSYCQLAATAIIFAAATVAGSIAASAAAEDDEDKDDYPRTVISTKVTHLRKPPFLFSSYTMLKRGNVLLSI